jgi:hypothetical protein
VVADEPSTTPDSPTSTTRGRAPTRSNPGTGATTSTRVGSSGAAGPALDPAGEDGGATTDGDSTEPTTGSTRDGATVSTEAGSEETASGRVLSDADGSAFPVVIGGAVVVGLLALGGGLAAQHRALAISNGTPGTTGDPDATLSEVEVTEPLEVPVDGLEDGAAGGAGT